MGIQIENLKFSTYIWQSTNFGDAKPNTHLNTLLNTLWNFRGIFAGCSTSIPRVHFLPSLTKSYDSLRLFALFVHPIPKK